MNIKWDTQLIIYFECLNKKNVVIYMVEYDEIAYSVNIVSHFRVTYAAYCEFIFGWFLFNKMYSNGSYIYVARVLAKFYSWGVSRKCPKLHVFLVKNKGGKNMDAKRRNFTRQMVFALICTILFCLS